MQDIKRRYIRFFKLGLGLLALYFVSMSVLVIWMTCLDKSHDSQGYPVRGLTVTSEEMPEHKFNVRFQFEYQKDGQWIPFERVGPVRTYAHAKWLVQRKPAKQMRVVFEPDKPEDFRFKEPVAELATQGANQSWPFVGFLLISAWLLLTARKLSIRYGLASFLFLASLALGWVGISCVAEELEDWARVNSWVATEAEVDFYEPVAPSLVNTRYSYEFQNRQYEGAKVLVEGKADPLLPSRQIAMMIFSGSKKTTCYVNPDNPEEVCLTRVNEFDLLVGGLMAFSALGLQGLVFLSFGVVTLRLGKPSRLSVFLGGGLCLLAVVYLFSWLPSVIALLLLSTPLIRLLTCALLASPFVLGGLLFWRDQRIARRKHQELRIALEALAVDRRNGSSKKVSHIKRR